MICNNFISGNRFAGVELANGTTRNLVERNYIGTDLSGTLQLGNARAGVLVIGESSDGNRITGNSICANGRLEIDLGGDGVTRNDRFDVDAGPNQLQNFPRILLAVTFFGGLRVRGVLHSTPRTTFTIEFFASAAPDASGFGEGQRFLGQIRVVTRGNGNAVFRGIVGSAAPGEWVTATAIEEPTGNTSEFSRAVEFRGRRGRFVTPLQAAVSDSSTNSRGPRRSNLVRSTPSAIGRSPTEPVRWPKAISAHERYFGHVDRNRSDELYSNEWNVEKEELFELIAMLAQSRRSLASVGSHRT